MDNVSYEELAGWLESTKHVGSIGITAKFYVKEDQVDKFCEVMKNNVEHTQGEAGMLVYKLHADFKESNIFWLVEEWENVSYLKAHCSTEIFQRNGALINPLLKSPWQIGLYKALS